MSSPSVRAVPADAFAAPCPIAVEELGRINDYTTVVCPDIDCTDVRGPGGGTGSVTGTVVADVIQGYTDTLPVL